MKEIQVALIMVLAFGVSDQTYAGCSQQEGQKKLINLSQKMSQAAQHNQLSTEQQSKLGVRMNEAGSALGAGKYDKACQMYDQIAKDFNLK